MKDNIYVGMSLLCKKDYKYTDSGLSLISDVYYDVVKIKEAFKIDNIVLGIRNIYLNKDGSTFNVYFTDSDKDKSNYIWDFFYTKDEERKLKLEKLNKIK